MIRSGYERHNRWIHRPIIRGSHYDCSRGVRRSVRYEPFRCVQATVRNCAVRRSRRLGSTFDSRLFPRVRHGGKSWRRGGDSHIAYLCYRLLCPGSVLYLDDQEPRWGCVGIRKSLHGIIAPACCSSYRHRRLDVDVPRSSVAPAVRALLRLDRLQWLTKSLDRTGAGRVSAQFQRHWPPASVSSVVGHGTDENPQVNICSCRRRDCSRVPIRVAPKGRRRHFQREDPRTRQ